MGRTYKDDRDNLPYKGRRKFNSKRPKKGNRKQSRFGDDPSKNKPTLFEKDNSIYEDHIIDDYYDGDEDAFEKFTRGR